MPWDNDRIHTLLVLLRSIEAILLRQEQQLGDLLKRTEHNQHRVDEQMQQVMLDVRKKKGRKRLSQPS